MPSASLTVQNFDIGARRRLFGTLLVLLFAILSAARDVIVGKMIQYFPPLEYAFFDALIAFFCFLLLNLGRGRALLRKIPSSLPVLLVLNFSTAAFWIGAILSLRYLEPAISSGLILGVCPIAAFLLEPLLFKTSLNSKVFPSLMILLLALVLMGLAALFEGGALSGLTRQNIIYGLMATFGTGLAIATSSLLAKKLYLNSWYPSEVLFVRMIFLAGLAGCYLITKKSADEASLFNDSQWQFAALVSIIGAALPLYLSLKGLEFISTTRFTVLLCTLPIFSFLFQLFDPRIEFSVIRLMSLLMMLAALVHVLRKE